MIEERRHNTDGRIARGERTREAILAAHTALLRDGVLKPTGRLIAERAGISVRTLWLNFSDLETLLTASAAHWQTADEALRRSVDPVAPLAQRIEDFVAHWVARHEHLAPAARSAALGEPFSPALQASRREHVGRLRRDVEAVFGAEIGRHEEPDQLRHALFVASSWPSWSSLRDDLGLDVDDAAAVMRSMLTALLPTR